MSVIPPELTEYIGTLQEDIAELRRQRDLLRELLRKARNISTFDRDKSTAMAYMKLLGDIDEALAATEDTDG